MPAKAATRVTNKKSASKSTSKKKPAAKKNARKTVPTNAAVAMPGESELEQREALARIAFGESWKKLEGEIDERLADFPEDAPIRQSTRRAMVMIQGMMFDRL